ncbi:MAG: undecaprenyl diphosphate synthase family protein [Deltaproteobacteria bacterium]|nr:undecaprenyl diphosphate synthase family protein [Deltaproteobacteria bacterium]
MIVIVDYGMGNLRSAQKGFEKGGHEAVISDDPKDIERAEGVTAGGTRLNLTIALSYGGRTEIVDACRALLREGADPDSLTIESFAEKLYTSGQPDPDFLFGTELPTSGPLDVSDEFVCFGFDVLFWLHRCSFHGYDEPKTSP